VARTELEEPTTRELFDAMWPLTAGRRVTKRRHCIRHGALTWEIDEFTDRDLVLAEVELRNAAEQPDLPDWLAPLVVREVTGEPEYVNANLAR
jgi:CYTH domain-containing protein